MDKSKHDVLKVTCCQDCLGYNDDYYDDSDLCNCSFSKKRDWEISHVDYMNRVLPDKCPLRTKSVLVVLDV